MAWSLNHAQVFTKGCKDLIISTDHKPLLGILNDRPLGEIENPRLSRIKEKTLQFTFSIIHNKGKWHRAPDALSRSPIKAECFKICVLEEDDENMAEFIASDNISPLAVAELSAITCNFIVTLDELRRCTKNDVTMQALSSIIESGFPSTRHETDEAVRSFYNVREHLWLQDGLIMFKDRLVIPRSLRAVILRTLHSAHQGTEGMRARASGSVYWPGINQDIRQTRDNCKECDFITPSQAREPLNMIPASNYPFQHICADEFEIRGTHYIVVVDRFSGWILLYHIKTTLTSQQLIKIFRSIFTSYGVSERLYTDGGFPFQSRKIKSFFSSLER